MDTMDNVTDHTAANNNKRKNKEDVAPKKIILQEATGSIVRPKRRAAIKTAANVFNLSKELVSAEEQKYGYVRSSDSDEPYEPATEEESSEEEGEYVEEGPEENEAQQEEAVTTESNIDDKKDRPKRSKYILTTAARKRQNELRRERHRKRRGEAYKPRLNRRSDDSCTMFVPGRTRKGEPSMHPEAIKSRIRYYKKKKLQALRAGRSPPQIPQLPIDISDRHSATESTKSVQRESQTSNLPETASEQIEETGISSCFLNVQEIRTGIIPDLSTAKAIALPKKSFGNSVADDATRCLGHIAGTVGTHIQRLILQIRARTIIDAGHKIRDQEQPRLPWDGNIDLEDETEESEGSSESAVKTNTPNVRKRSVSNKGRGVVTVKQTLGIDPVKRRMTCVDPKCDAAPTNITRHYRRYHRIPENRIRELTTIGKKLQANLALGDSPMDQDAFNSFLRECPQWLNLASSPLVRDLDANLSPMLLQTLTAVFGCLELLSATRASTDPMQLATNRKAIRDSAIHAKRVAITQSVGSEVYAPHTLREMLKKHTSKTSSTESRLLYGAMAEPQPSTSAPLPAVTYSVEEIQTEGPLVRKVVTCSSCKAIVCREKILHHLRGPHALKIKKDIKRLQQESLKSSRLAKLKAPLKRGGDVGSLIEKDNISTEELIPPSAIVLNPSEVVGPNPNPEPIRKNSVVATVKKITRIYNFKASHPKMLQLVADFKNYQLEKHNNDRTAYEKVNRLVDRLMAILIMFVTNKSPTNDLDCKGIYDNIYAIVDNYRLAVKCLIRISTVTRHLDVLDEFGKYLQEKNHESGRTLIPNFDLTTITSAASRCRDMMRNDKEWNQTFESNEEKKERQLLGASEIVLFETSQYVTNILEGTLKYHEAAVKAKETGGCIEEEIRDDELTIKMIPTVQNALSLRNVLMTLAVCDLGRRSKEMATFSLDSFAEPKHIDLNCAIFKVKDHKNWRHKPCYIRFGKKEFIALTAFVRYYRPHITTDNSPTAPVFPPLEKKTSTTANEDENEPRVYPSGAQSQQLSVSSIGQITDKTYRRAGGTHPYRFVPRRVRHAFVTVATNEGANETQLCEMAFLMGHLRRTQAEHYTVGVVVNKIERVRKMIKSFFQSAASDREPQSEEVTTIPHHQLTSSQADAESASNLESIHREVVESIGLKPCQPPDKSQMAYTETEANALPEADEETPEDYIHNIQQQLIQDEKEVEVGDDNPFVENRQPSPTKVQKILSARRLSAFIKDQSIPTEAEEDQLINEGFSGLLENVLMPEPPSAQCSTTDKCDIASVDAGSVNLRFSGSSSTTDSSIGRIDMSRLSFSDTTSKTDTSIERMEMSTTLSESDDSILSQRISSATDSSIDKLDRPRMCHSNSSETSSYVQNEADADMSMETPDSPPTLENTEAISEAGEKEQLLSLSESERQLQPGDEHKTSPTPTEQETIIRPQKEQAFPVASSVTHMETSASTELKATPSIQVQESASPPEKYKANQSPAIMGREIYQMQVKLLPPQDHGHDSMQGISMQASDESTPQVSLSIKKQPYKLDKGTSLTHSANLPSTSTEPQPLSSAGEAAPISAETSSVQIENVMEDEDETQSISTSVSALFSSSVSDTSNESKKISAAQKELLFNYIKGAKPTEMELLRFKTEKRISWSYIKRNVPKNILKEIGAKKSFKQIQKLYKKNKLKSFPI